MVGAILWTLLALNIIRLLGHFHFLRPLEGPLPDGLPAIDLIVPARNEERDFEASLATLLGQDYPSFRIIAVDDESTDGTLEIMRRMAENDQRLIVVAGDARPPGWVGKTWAVHQGYLRSTAAWICFVDADMVLDPRALATAIETARRAEADMFSMMPRLECRTFWQGSIAVSILQCLVHLYPVDRVNNKKSTAAIAAGGFILIRREAYERAGGHEAGRHDIVDDIQLARRVKATGGSLNIRLAPDLASTHMYGTFGEIWRGLVKNAYAGLGYKFYNYALAMTGALVLAWGPIVGIARGLVQGSWERIAFGVWGELAQAAATLPLALFLRLNPLMAFAVPMGITAYAAISTASVWHHHRGRILWKGRAMSSAEVDAALKLSRIRTDRRKP
jgi:hopene-associated glycosyltransferase HpnB